MSIHFAGGGALERSMLLTLVGCVDAPSSHPGRSLQCSSAFFEVAPVLTQSSTRSEAYARGRDGNTLAPVSRARHGGGTGICEDWPLNKVDPYGNRPGPRVKEDDDQVPFRGPDRNGGRRIRLAGTDEVLGPVAV